MNLAPVSLRSFPPSTILNDEIECKISSLFFSLLGDPAENPKNHRHLLLRLSSK